MCLNGVIMSKHGVRKNDSFLKSKVAGEHYSASFYSRCGTCIVCMKRNQTEWCVRNYYESLDKKYIYFVTLTYNEKIGVCYDGSLIMYDHVQDFLRKCRETLGEFTYFVGCEYGKDSHRANYHIIMYSNEAIISDCVLFKKSSVKNNAGVEIDTSIYKSENLETIWGNGFVTVQLVEQAPHVVVNYLCEFSPFKGDANYRKKVLFAKLYGIVAVSDLEKRNSEVSALYKKHKEQRHSSIGLGFNSFYKRIDEFMNTGKVYIGGLEYNIPFSWLEKLSQPEFGYGSDKIPIPYNIRCYARKLYQDMIEDEKSVSVRLLESQLKGEELTRKYLENERKRMLGDNYM